MRSPFAFDWVLERAAEDAAAPAVGTPSGWSTYGELAGAIAALAARLAEAGVGPGSFVVMTVPAGPAAVAGALAVQSLGACAVEVNRELGPGPIDAILEQTGARHAIVPGKDATRWAEQHRSRPLAHLFVVHPSAPPALAAALGGLPWTHLPEKPVGSGPGPDPVRDAAAPALLVYTSGSTGVPRGVVQTHENVAANTEAICGYLELTPADRALSILPLFYCYGKSVLQTHLHAGGSVFFDHRFLYPRVVLEALGAEGCTGFSGVPHTFELIRRTVDPHELQLGSLRYLTQAGGAMRPETVRWVRDAFAPARLFVMYGQTEATARLSYLPPERADDKEGSVGRGLGNVELKVVDDAGAELAVGEVGQVVARGPSITPGYFRAPEETAAILRDGWLWTGDLGQRDREGFLFLVGRAKDVLKLSGHRVSAAEIEQALEAHPSVAEAAVVGVALAAGDEAAIAFVVLRAGAGEDAAGLRRHCRERLPAFKVPKEVRFVEALPRTAAGKVAKAELKERVAREQVLEGRPPDRSGAEGD